MVRMGSARPTLCSPAPNAPCLHLPGGPQVGSPHANTALSGDKLASPLPVHTHTHAHTHTCTHTYMHTHTHVCTPIHTVQFCFAARALRHFHVYNGRQWSRSPKSLQFNCCHGNPDTWQGARVLLQPCKARGRGEKSPQVCVWVQWQSQGALTATPHAPTPAPTVNRHTHTCAVCTHVLYVHTPPSHMQGCTRTPAHRRSHGVCYGAGSPAA